MKHHIAIALLVAATGHAVSVKAQAWQTTDTYRAGTDLGASAGDIGTDATGSIIYSVGSAIVSDGTHMATVRASNDSGATWTTLDMFAEPGWNWAHYRGVASAPNGSLYVAGELYNSPNPGKRWLIRRSVDQGFTWTTVDSPEYLELGSCPSAGDIKVAGSGEVFAAGYQHGNDVPFQWVVRKSQTGDANTWATVDALGTAGASEARSIAFDASGNVFVSGHVVNASNGSAVWTVRRSQNKGLTWTTVDSYQEGNALSAGAEGIANVSGTIYVAGYARGFAKGRYTDYWVVRRSADGGATWSIVDKAVNSAGGFLSPTGMTTDALGNIWVCGFVGSSSLPNQWLVRKGTPGAKGITWSNSDVFQSMQAARANGICVDAFGNVFATGRTTDSVENWWVTRRLH
jgi:hypothetical protein